MSNQETSADRLKFAFSYFNKKYEMSQDEFISIAQGYLAALERNNPDKAQEISVGLKEFYESSVSLP